MTTLKSIITTAGLLIAIGLPVSAQIGELRQNFAIGVNGGVNYSNVSFQPTIKQNGLLGATGGITARYISEKYFAMICGVQVELNYAQRGWDEKFDQLDDDRSYSRTMNYLEIPFLAHLAFGKDRGAQFFLNLGPQMGFLLSDKEETAGTWKKEQLDREPYGKKIQNNFDYGIVGGAGLEIRTKAGNFLIEGRYYFGLADFYNSTKKDYFSRSAHTTISAKIAYLFDLKK
ncbi:porin family protein [Bacteroides sp.]|uniref:porin family protein n=1 Tax=Bacteroides sp. TaxID=29523 RepID=UPI001B47F66B|nr:porin family protein [Bacteroides sp.]MBP6064655.1 PorT family protein [Bacteroides sp.]MBP6067129.1 PorT family protein [Bacteroides sp.]MBP6935880.1 PorT family protein [Bacteroides sp.]MBP8621886.1 PorT family protein [Bacteroides sp.]MBP9585465.1 PorT family protein [Bacteroides sp.]